MSSAPCNIFYIDFILQKTNKKKKERDFEFYSLYHQGQIFYAFSSKRRAFQRVLGVILRPTPSIILYLIKKLSINGNI